MDVSQWYAIHQSLQDGNPSNLWINPEYGGQDCDSIMFLGNFVEPKGCKVLEVGANEEASARILADNGYKIAAVDLRRFEWRLPHNYVRIEGDFVQIAPFLTPDYDVVFSTSAIEHFGRPIYSFWTNNPNYDIQAMDLMYDLLKPGGRCYITVPYGQEHLEEADWRVYNKHSLINRLIRRFSVEKKIFFLSGACNCPDKDGYVTEEDADKWSGDPPHVTVFLKMIKE